MPKKKSKAMIGKSLSQRVADKPARSGLSAAEARILEAGVAAGEAFEASEKHFRTVAAERLSLLDQMARTGAPRFVDVRVWEESEAGSSPRHVRAYIEKNGGSAVQGFRFYENEYSLSGEAHVIWQSPAGELVDISPPWSPRCDGDPSCRERVAFVANDAPGPGVVIPYDGDAWINAQEPFLAPAFGSLWDNYRTHLRGQVGQIIEADR